MNAEATSQSATALKKLSVKTVHGKIRQDEIPKDGKTVTPIMQIIGMATGVVSGDTDFGAYDKLIGQFEAVDLVSGELFTAPECFVPEPYNSMIAQKLKGSQNVPGVSAVEFAFEIGVMAPTEDQTVKYTYSTKVLRDASAGDPLETLRARVPRLAALAPPSSGPAIEDQSAGKSGKKK